MSTALIPLPAGAHGVEDPEQATVVLRYLPHGESLLDDPQFNDGIAEWTASADATIDHDAAADMVGGAGSLHAERTAATGNELARSDPFTVHPHVAYIIAAWLRGTNARLRLAWFDEDDNEVTDIFEDWLVVTPEADDASEFRRIHAHGLAPAEAVTARVILEETDQTIGNEAWLDGISVQVLIPVAVEPFNVPTIQSGQTGGDLTFAPSLGGQHLGDVRVFDMEDGDDMSLPSGDYTRIRGLRHRFRGDVLVEGSGLRLRVGRGLGDAAAVHAAYYDDGVWSDPVRVLLSTGGGGSSYAIGTYEIETFGVAEASPGRARIVTRDSNGDRATLTVRRGEPFIHVATSRAADEDTGWRQFIMEFHGADVNGPRLSIINGVELYRDAAVDDARSTSATSHSEPQFYCIGPDHGAILGISHTFQAQSIQDNGGEGDTDALGAAHGRQILWRETNHDWRDDAGRDEEPGRVRHHFIILSPWPWAKQRHFVECEDDPDNLNTGTTTVADAAASGGSYVELDADGDETGFAIKRGRDIPEGEHVLVCRARYASTETDGKADLIIRSSGGTIVAESRVTLGDTFDLFSMEFSLEDADPEDLEVVALPVEQGGQVANDEDLSTGGSSIPMDDQQMAWLQSFDAQSEDLEGIDLAMNIGGTPDADLNVGIYPLAFDVQAQAASRQAVVITGSAGWTDASNLSDRDFASLAKWGTGSGTSRGALEWDFGSGNAIQLRGFLWTAKTNGHSTFHMALQYSDDGSSWTTVLNDTSVGTSTKQTRRMWCDGTEGAHRYWRARITTSEAGESWVYEWVPLALRTDVDWTTFNPSKNGSTPYREPATFVGDANTDVLKEGGLTIPASEWASDGFTGTQQDFASPLALVDGEPYCIVVTTPAITTGSYDAQWNFDEFLDGEWWFAQAQDTDFWEKAFADIGFRLFFAGGGTVAAIDVDYLALFPVGRNDDTPDDVWFPLNVAQDALMQASTRATVRRMP